MKLGEPEPIGADDGHHRGVRHVDADLDHRGADEDLDLAAVEAFHHILFLGGGRVGHEQPDAKCFELAIGESFERRCHAGGHHVLRLVDQRRHDERLATFVEPLANEVPLSLCLLVRFNQR